MIFVETFRKNEIRIADFLGTITPCKPSTKKDETLLAT